jgi:hypothetical protein
MKVRKVMRQGCSLVLQGGWADLLQGEIYKHP